ncbi:hypothetical protein CC2G_007813 [Coprinopsis cinerea AmutBmut pab1-1]|nr:hypothetical protein CC2G_007813 [Coprinopsis cinerea AmutBmut pab1-1]
MATFKLSSPRSLTFLVGERRQKGRRLWVWVQRSHKDVWETLIGQMEPPATAAMTFEPVNWTTVCFNHK